MVCEPILLARALQKKEKRVYMYNFNQTLLDPIIASVYNISGMGVVHTSEFAYTYGNLSHYNVSGYPFYPTQADHDLAQRASRSWARFAYSGDPSPSAGRSTELSPSQPKALQGWLPAFWSFNEVSTPGYTPRRPGHTYVYTIGGPEEGLWPLDGEGSVEAVRGQRLEEKCAFFNDAEFIRRAGF